MSFNAVRYGVLDFWPASLKGITKLLAGVVVGVSEQKVMFQYSYSCVDDFGSGPFTAWVRVNDGDFQQFALVANEGDVMTLLDTLEALDRKRASAQSEDCV